MQTKTNIKKIANCIPQAPTIAGSDNRGVARIDKHDFGIYFLDPVIIAKGGYSYNN